MEKKKFLVLVGLILVLAITFFLLNKGTINAADCRIIRIVGMATHESVRIEPSFIQVEKGTCVIWFNNTPGESIKIIFEDAKKCDDITDASVDFKFDDKRACFISATYVHPGGTASLRFQKEGRVDYLMEAEGQLKKFKGTIYVR